MSVTVKADTTKNCKASKQTACSKKNFLSHINKIQINVNRAVKKQNITERPSRAKCSFKLIAIKSKDKLN
jgi:hypothetical protein